MTDAQTALAALAKLGPLWGLIGALVATLAYRAKTAADARKTNAEADVTQGEGWQLLYNTQQQQIDSLTKRLAAVEMARRKDQSENEQLRHENETLRAEVGELRLEVAELRRRLANQPNGRAP